MTGDGTLPWPELLDALEERTRRLVAVVEAGGGTVPPPVPLLTDSPLPPEMAGRVRALLAETQRVERLAAARTAKAGRALRYGQA